MHIPPSLSLQINIHAYVVTAYVGSTEYKMQISDRVRYKSYMHMHICDKAKRGKSRLGMYARHHTHNHAHAHVSCTTCFFISKNIRALGDVEIGTCM